MGKRIKKRGHMRELIAVSLIRGVAGPGLNSSLGIFFVSASAVLGVGVGTLAWSVSAASLAGMLFLPAASRVYERMGLRMTALLGVLLVGLSYLSLAFCTHIAWWFILAVPFGIGTVLIVNLLGPLALDRSADSYGSSLGWMMTLAGLAAIPLQPLVTWAISFGGSRAGYLLGGAFALAVMLPCVFVLPPAAHKETSPPRAPEAHLTGRDFTLLYVLLVVIVGYNAFHQHIAALGKNLSLSSGQIGLALGLSAAGAAVGGLLIGYMTRRAGGTGGGYLTLAVGGSAVLLFLWGGGTPFFFSLAAFLHGVASAAIGITVQSLARERCRTSFGRTLSRLLTAGPLATVIFTPLWGMIYDRTGSYTVALAAMLAMLAVGAGSLALFTRQKNTLSTGVNRV